MQEPLRQQPMPQARAAVPGGWMMRPQGIVGCPPGLEYLTQVDQLLVQQQIELLEAYTGWETNNKYRIVNTMGQQCYFAFEDSDTCMRLCCGTQRSFVIHVVDNTSSDVIRISRDFNCCACPGCFACCSCCNFEVMVEAPPGVPVGFVRSECFFYSPQLAVMDENRTPVLHIDGPCICIPHCCSDYDFSVSSIGSNSGQIGRIRKQWSGFIREAVTDADNFGVTFPRDLDVKVKATLLGALFLIDFMFFEKGNESKSD